ncbi:MAG TPA: hypothetical protein VIV59_03770 [Anaeromyxobacteraceae bacterium]
MRSASHPRAPLAALLLLAGCPLPQSVPSVPAGSVTPPRIVEDASLTPSGTTIAFDPACPTAQPFTVTATAADENFSEAVGFRWFVDYDATRQPRYTPLDKGSLDPPTAEPFTLRPVKPDFVIRPAQFGPSAPHVLELVVSNGFDVCPPDPLAAPQPLPCRTPQTTAQNSYEVQSHKWVFVPVAACAGTTCPACP